MTKLSPTGPYPKPVNRQRCRKKKKKHRPRLKQRHLHSQVTTGHPTAEGHLPVTNTMHDWCLPLGSLRHSAMRRHVCASSTAATVHWVSAPRKVEAWRLATKGPGQVSSVIGSDGAGELVNFGSFQRRSMLKIEEGSRFTPLQVGPAFLQNSWNGIEFSPLFLPTSNKAHKGGESFWEAQQFALEDIKHVHPSSPRYSSKLASPTPCQPRGPSTNQRLSTRFEVVVPPVASQP